MKRAVLMTYFLAFILLSCDEHTIDDNYIEIKQAVPNPAKVGDTLNILITNINNPLNVDNINQVKIRLDENGKFHTFQATGYYDQFRKVEYGSFSHSYFVDSLARNFQPIIQCLVDSSFPIQSKIGVQLNEKILKSNIILNIIK